jgi:DNA ligase-associated metallophosphoesterase
MSDAFVTFGGETLRLLPERAAFWQERSTLLIADPHWGKAATFRSAGLFVPRGTTSSGIERLDALLGRLEVRRLVFLGDFLHARAGRVARTLAALRDWRSRHPTLDITLVRGNHDRGAGDPPDELEIRCVDAPMIDGSLALTHHPVARPDAFVVAGHLHPGVRLIGRGRQRQRLPCFWISGRVCVLPAFGDFTGMAVIEPQPTDRVLVVAGDSVINIGWADDGDGTVTRTGR